MKKIDKTKDELSVEEILKESEDRYRDIVENSNDLICTHDLDGNILWANKAAIKITGYSQEELLKMNLQSLIVPEYRNLFNTYLTKMKANGHDNGIMAIQTKTGERRIWQYNNTLRTQGVAKSIVRGMVNDITERKHAEEEIRKSENKYRNIFENIQDVYYETSIDGTILEVSPSIERLTHLMYKSEDLIGKSMYDFYFDPKERDFLIEHLINSKGLFDYEIKFRNRDNTAVFCSTIATINFNSEGKPVKIIGSIRDITERKLSENKLIASEIRYRRLFESAKDGILILDAETGKIVDVNPFLVKLLGYSKEQFLDKEIWEIGFFKDVVANKKKFLELQENEYARYEDLPLETAEGRKIHVEFVSKVYLVNEHKVIQCNIRDITERKHAEEEIRKLYRGVHQSPAAVIITNIKGDIEYVNSKTLEVTGYKISEVLGKNPRIFQSGEKTKEEYAELWNTILAGKEWRGEFHNKRKNGELYWENTLISPIKNDKEEITNFIAIKEDITERKSAAQKLIVSERKYKELTTLLPQSVFEANLNGIITYANDFASETFGYSKEESLNILNYKMMVVPEERDKIAGNARQILNGNKNNGGEYTALRKNGTVFPCLVYASPIMHDEKPIGIRGIIIDISEIKKTEQELILAKEKAEEANKLKDAFISNISHEIRTPLNGILGMTNLIKESLAQFISKDDMDCFNAIDSSSKRIVRTTDMILNFSRLQVGDFPVNKELLKLPSIINNLILEYMPTALTNSLELTFDNKCGDGNLMADVYCISNAISNLIDNALKYTHKGYVKVILYKDPIGFLKVDVKDSGIGIDVDYLEHLFEPYTQEVIGYSRPYDGIGLGLSLVKKYLDLNNATISAVSKKGEGTTFTIHFATEVNSKLGKVIETSQKHPTKKVTLKHKHSEGEKPLILIVEDNELNQKVLRILLSKKYNSVVVPSASEALEALKTNPIELILMDISIQGDLNGLELTTLIKKKPEYSSIPVIAVTAHAFLTDRQNSLDAGCDEYISKPFDLIELYEKINKFLSINF